MKLPRTYHAGREARQAGQSKCAPGSLSWADRHWWLAGWNDADLELAGSMDTLDPLE